MKTTLSGFSFQRTGSGHAIEDRLLCDWLNRAIAVADGVSRFEYGEHADRESARVGIVAECFCATAIHHLTTVRSETASEVVEEIGGLANVQIAAINCRLGFEKTDYLSRDPYATVGACAVVTDAGLLSFGYIGDVDIARFNHRVGLESLSRDQLVGARRALESQRFASRAARQRFVRSELRNRPGARDDLNRCCGYGVLNGDPRGEVFWRTGAIQLQNHDVMVISSDGARGFVGTTGFSTMLDHFHKTGRVGDAQAACELLSRELVNANSGVFTDDASLVVARMSETVA